MATFLIDIFWTRCAVTIFSQISSEYAFISVEDKMIFYYYLLYHITAGTLYESVGLHPEQIMVLYFEPGSPDIKSERVTA
jgi:hypothetical protein